MNKMDLNSDIGELPGDEGRAFDRAILEIVTSCNIACGGHAGDESSMRETLKAASERGVRVGAHPSYPDRENFGRQAGFEISADTLLETLKSQIGSLQDLAEQEGIAVSYVKPHGALYNDAAKDSGLAGIVCQSCVGVEIPALMGPPNSELQKAAHAAGLVFLSEGFVDRAYEADGSLRARSLPGAVLHDAMQVMSQALEFAQEGAVRTFDDQQLALQVQSLCLHGDTPGAAELARDVRRALEAGGVKVTAGDD